MRVPPDIIWLVLSGVWPAIGHLIAGQFVDAGVAGDAHAHALAVPSERTPAA